LLAKIVEQADVEPHQRIRGLNGKDEFVVLTEKNYQALRDALYVALAAVTALDEQAEMVPGAELQARALAIDIRSARRAKGLTQAALAKRAGIPQSQVSRVERDPTRTTLRTLKRIARALDLPVRSIAG
jgi:DNA-binding XRE family transcriptional regulator